MRNVWYGLIALLGHDIGNEHLDHYFRWNGNVKSVSPVAGLKLRTVACRMLNKGSFFVYLMKIIEEMLTDSAVNNK